MDFLSISDQLHESVLQNCTPAGRASAGLTHQEFRSRRGNAQGPEDDSERPVRGPVAALAGPDPGLGPANAVRTDGDDRFG
jgi:hypothetical protein